MEYNKNKLIELRNQLNQLPELSGNEYQTVKLIKRSLMPFQPDHIVEQLGGTGLAAIYNGKEAGPTVLFRCELDALPIIGANQPGYPSMNNGLAHQCGHDGHMSIMVGIAEAIYNDPPVKGRMVLLFQPSEENGQGAPSVLHDKKFEAIKPDYVFALHNLPGYPERSLILRDSTFAAASKGMINRLYGKTSHAGEPENGITPALAMADIIRDLTYLPENYQFENLTLVTVIHSRLGNIAFGTSPGYAEVMATLRSFSDNDMELLSEYATQRVKDHAKQSNLKAEVSWTEVFPATVNDKHALKVVQKVAEKRNMPFIYLNEPLRWSEDFSYFTGKYPGVLFGLGAGTDHAPLHNPDYDFPDHIIVYGIEIYFGIYQYFLK